MLEAKDTSASVLQKKKKSSQKFFRRSQKKKTKKKVFTKIFQALHEILTIQRKNSAVLEPRTGQFSRT